MKEGEKAPGSPTCETTITKERCVLVMFCNQRFDAGSGLELAEARQAVL